MKLNRYQIGIVTSIAISFASVAHATSFLTVYQQAIKNDPEFAQAQATWESQKMNLPIADSNYLPQLTGLANGARNYTYNKPPTLSTINDYNWSYGYSLTLSQTIFDLGAWNAIKSADAVVKAAMASYIAAQQSLMQRTAQAYFDVLKAYETLNFTIANKKAVWQQYTTSQKKFKAGLIAIMDVYDAKSRYDQVTAQEITARNNLSNKIEALHAITGKYYTSLNGISTRARFVKPQPVDMNAWTNVALKQNYNLIAQRYNVLSALHQISQQAAGDIPTLDMSSGFSEAHENDNSNDITITDEATIGLNLTYKPIQGGLVYASTKQARYNYVAASDKLGVVYRQVINQTHNNFTGIMASIMRVEADRLRIVSANKALIATEAGLKVGARTMVDVLNDLTTLYQAQQQFVDDQYTYLTNFVDLKVAAGTLKASDMARINHWMSRKVPLQKYSTPWASFDLSDMDMKSEAKVDNEAQDKNINYTDSSDTDAVLNPVAAPAQKNKTDEIAKPATVEKTEDDKKLETLHKTLQLPEPDSVTKLHQKMSVIPKTDIEEKSQDKSQDKSVSASKQTAQKIHEWWDFLKGR